MGDTLPVQIAAIPYLKGALSDFGKYAGEESCQSLQPCGVTHNKDHSTSYNYTAVMQFTDDGGSYTDKQVPVSLVEKEGKFTLVRGDATQRETYDVSSGKTTTSNPSKESGHRKAPEVVEPVKDMAAEKFTAEYTKYDAQQKAHAPAGKVVAPQTPSHGQGELKR